MDAKSIQVKKACLVETTCPYCGVGCGVDAELATDKLGNTQLIGVSGTNNHPANFGKLCVKGTNLAKTNDVNGRLLAPEIDGKRTDWSTAINQVANIFDKTIAEYGPDSVAFYVSGQLLTEDYYVANKLMKGYIGSANIDTNSRLCMSSAVAAYKRSFGADAVPCSYEDLDCSELLVLVGSNAAWTHPVLFQRIERAKKRNPNTKIVVIDPRKTASCELADLHLQIKPGSDVALFNGLLSYLHANEFVDSEFVDRHTNGFDDALNMATQLSNEQLASLCDLPLERLQQFYQLFAQTGSAVTFYSMGVNQSSSGVDKANAIINCHLATGKIGKPGSGPFSITGQPNAMGGREVGGLANMLAAHMDIENSQHKELVQEFWQSPNIPNRAGLKAVDLFDRVEKGEVKAIWIMATNPLVSMPNRMKIESALTKCPHVIVSDCVSDNDTLKFADIRLPATSWSEKNGTVTNSERRISRQRGFIKPPEQAKHDWQIICDVAKAMGYQSAFDFDHPSQIFDEHARLSAYQNHENGVLRDFNLNGLMNLSKAEYNNLKPVQWPVLDDDKKGTERLFTDNKFYTPNQKANFIGVEFNLPSSSVSSAYPYVLNTGRLRDQWHTMTRTGKAHELMMHTPNASLSIHPIDAEALSISEGDLICISSQFSVDKPIVLPAKISDETRKGELFVPIHWSETWGSSNSIARLFGDAQDAISGQPELKFAAVNIVKQEVIRFASVLSIDPIDESLLKGFDYWTKQLSAFGFIYQIAQLREESSFTNLIEKLTLVEVWLTKGDEANLTGLGYKQDKLHTFYHSQMHSFTINEEWLTTLFQSENISESDRSQLLRNSTPDSYTKGKLICSCYKVHESSIIDAILAGADSVEALGQELQCGTNCGSCKSELSQYVRKLKLSKSDRIEVEEIEC